MSNLHRRLDKLAAKTKTIDPPTFRVQFPDKEPGPIMSAPAGAKWAGLAIIKVVYGDGGDNEGH